MKKIIMLLLILLISTSSFSQENCNCRQALSQLIDEIESEYPGFNEKTKDTIMYNDFKERLIEKSNNNSDCYDILNHYLSFFRDPHIYLIQTNVTQNNQNDNISDARVDITLDDFYGHLDKSNDQLEGVWESSYYKVGIIKEDNQYNGFIIEASNDSWKANQIKLTLLEGGAANYYMGNHSLEEDSFELIDECILVFKNTNAVFVKKSPKPKLSESEIESKLDKIRGFYFTKLTDKTSLLCISSFEDPYVAKIEKIVSDNQQAIENCENLIIDVRNNRGGTYDAYDEILPYIHTNNTCGVGQEFLVTQTLIDQVEDWFDDEEGKAKARRWIRMFEGNIGKFINTDTTNEFINETKIAEHSPKQIAILANKGTASSGEAFVFEAKQSKKVKVLGVPTYGALDYGSASAFEFGCLNYQLHMPTWRSMRLPDYPIDNIGIQPDIYLTESVKDWVQFTVDYLEN